MASTAFYHKKDESRNIISRLPRASIRSIIPPVGNPDGMHASLISNESMLDIVSHSAAQTHRLGTRLGELARAGDLYCLEGELGSGKTCFVQGLGRGLGVPGAIHSPTFILANEHPGGRLPLFHLDVYRISGAEEAIGIGLDDYISRDGVCVVEWAEKIRDALPMDRMWITFRHVDTNKRGLLVEVCGPRYQKLLADFRASAFG